MGAVDISPWGQRLVEAAERMANCQIVIAACVFVLTILVLSWLCWSAYEAGGTRWRRWRTRR